MDWTYNEDCFHYKTWSSRRGISVLSDLYYLLAKLPSFWYQKQGTFFLTWSMLKFELLRYVHKFLNNLLFSFYSLSSWEPKPLKLSHSVLPDPAHFPNFVCFPEISVWKSGHRTGKRLWPDQTMTDQDRKLWGPVKTVTAVQSTVLHIFENLKTEQRPVKTGLNWSSEPQKQAGHGSGIFIKASNWLF